MTVKHRHSQLLKVQRCVCEVHSHKWGIYNTTHLLKVEEVRVERLQDLEVGKDWSETLSSGLDRTIAFMTICGCFTRCAKDQTIQ